MEEGRLRNHEFFNGEFVDYLILAFYRETWATWPEKIPSLVDWWFNGETDSAIKH